MSPVLHELAGNGRGQQVLAVTAVVFLTSTFSTGISWWWSSEAEQRLGQIESAERQARRDLQVDLRRDIQVAQDQLVFRLGVLEARISQLEARDQAIQELLSQELRTIREDLARRMTIDERNEILRRRDAQMQDINNRLRELERAVYGRGTAR